MGLMLSLLVTCVGVLEALACWRHFRAGYLPLPAHADADAPPSSSSSDSGKSLGSYYYRDHSPSKYGLTPMLSEHRRNQPNTNSEDDGECSGEGRCSGVGGCGELVTDILPTIEELARESEEELGSINKKLGNCERELNLHENHFALENTEETSHSGSNLQRREFLDENENFCGDINQVDRTVSYDERVRRSSPKPRPPQLHFKAPTGDDNDEPEEFTTIRSPPKGTVDRVFSVEDIRGNVNKDNVEKITVNVPYDQRQIKDPETKTEVWTVNEEPGKEHSDSVSSAGGVQSRASLAWVEADELFRKRSPSQSPQRASPARKLPKNVDISWPSFTPQHLFRRSSAEPATSPAQLWPPSWDKRRASSGDVSVDPPEYSDDGFNRSSSLGPRTRRSTEPTEYFFDCPDPWRGIPTQQPEGTKDSDEALAEKKPSSHLDDSRVGGRQRNEHESLTTKNSDEKKLVVQKQVIPYTHNGSSPSENESEVKRGTEKSPITAEYSKNLSPKFFDQEGHSVGEESRESSKQKFVEQHEMNQRKLQNEITGSNRKFVKREQCEIESAEEVTERPLGEESARERFAMEKNEPRKKQRRPVKISSFEREDTDKAQRRSRRSIATEQSSDDEGDDYSAATQSERSASSQGPGPGEPFWLIFSGEYTKAMSKDWHSGHFSCWQCDESLTGQRYVLRDDHPYCIKCYESVFANVCEECNKIIGIDSKDLSYKEKHWHEACFLCNKCRVSLVDKQFGSKGEKIYCGNCYDAQFASRCDGCGEIFRAGTKKMEYKTRQWHEKCFCCCVCKTPIGTKSFIPREQEIYCANCYEEKFATRCVKCNKIITSGGVTYKNEPWHRECFTCTHCNASLAGQRFTSRDEKPYCAECFGELFAKRCTSCSKPITGIGGTRFISFEDRHWHNDCFICAMCKTSLVGRGFITDAEDIICPDCAKQKLM